MEKVPRSGEHLIMVWSVLKEARSNAFCLNLLPFLVSGANALLHCSIKALKWADLDFQADKSRTIVIIKRRSLNTTPFSVSEPKNSTDCCSYIPFIHSRSIKFLGCIIDGSYISDRNSVDEQEKKLITCLGIIDKFFFNGAQKLQILHYLLNPRIQWPLLNYKVLTFLATKLEQKISSFIR